MCWVYKKVDENGAITMHCELCEKFNKIKNCNSKDNIWVTTGCSELSFDKIKKRKVNEVHRQAEQQELDTTSNSQPNWNRTRTKEITKHQKSIQNLILASISLCQNDQSLNSYKSNCNLLEATGVQMLPSQVVGICYRNNDAALSFLQHTASVLHEELLEKKQASPVLGK
ncbi:unnamed protein product [Didymodactylos carnosus]|uniref:Uncharacterized protein n=1 Tax=Didymodactylos carnosus TaxID=1234261 RepID=A0A8S2PS81_9BILA|nr:unnamed protein product [Didymodactylos carnosus]CAF4060062.1 unnamed protein product [Didymodactylos carnosus]